MLTYVVEIKNRGDDMIIAIDGTASSGKSTLAKRLAKKLKFVYCNTGAIYRAITIKAIRKFGEDGYLNFSEDEISDYIEGSEIMEGFDDSGEFFITLDGEDVSYEINTPQISQFVAHYAKMPKLREISRQIQHRIATTNDSVVEGRDIGTVVFPNAEVKFYISASPEVRAKRRMADYEKKGKVMSFEDVLADLLERDRLDKEREISPLKPAEDAIIIDNSGNDPDVMVDVLAKYVKQFQQQAD